MQVKDVIEYYKHPTVFMKDTGMSYATWYRFIKTQEISAPSQLKIEKATKGALKADTLSLSKTKKGDTCVYKNVVFLDEKFFSKHAKKLHASLNKNEVSVTDCQNFLLNFLKESFSTIQREKLIYKHIYLPE